MKWVENGAADHAFTCGEDKPNIFLIGDSIRRGYCQTVKTELAEEANVFFVDDNCRSSQYVIFCMKRWAALFDRPEKVDVVQFNCGHWDVAHWHGYKTCLTSESEYAKNIQMIIDILPQFFPNAKLIFATTTPMNPDGGSVGGPNPRSNDTIDRYNAIATAIAEENGVTVSDLNRYMRDWGAENFTDYCHLTRDAFATLGREVARRLRAVIGSDKENA